MDEFDTLIDEVLALHLRFNPVEATFMGAPGYDHVLPPADPGAPARESAEASALLERVARTPVPPRPGAAFDARLAANQLRLVLRMNQERPRFTDPTWHTGEALFGVVSLLLPDTAGPTAEALAGRLAAIPHFLGEGAAFLAGAAAFSGWTERARTEVAAALRLLSGGLQLHPLWRPAMEADARRAAAAFSAFGDAVAALPDADPRCGTGYLDFLLRDVHAHPWTSAEALDAAEERIARATAALAETARRLDPGRSWQQQIADLNREQPDPATLPDTYRRFHEGAMETASGLLTPAGEFGLTFKPFPAWAEAIWADTYFIPYRCPPGFRPGHGSTYWVAPPGQSTATIKQTHAVHHGSVGHHTQNARARAAPARLARIANQSITRGISFQAGLTMGEGWACYVQDLMAECPGFYTPAELLFTQYHDLRNAACLQADLRFHRRDWTLQQMRDCYRDIALFPPGRIDFETVKNAIFPTNRAMYWLGVEQIKDARARWTGHPRDFHDGLIAHGHVPLAWAVDELFRPAHAACMPVAR